MNHQQEFRRMLGLLSGHHKAELYTKTQVHTADTDTRKGMPIYFILSSEIIRVIKVVSIYSKIIWYHFTVI